MSSSCFSTNSIYLHFSTLNSLFTAAWALLPTVRLFCWFCLIIAMSMVFFLKMTHVHFPDLTLKLARWMGKYYEPFESTFLQKKRNVCSPWSVIHNLDIHSHCLGHGPTLQLPLFPRIKLKTEMLVFANSPVNLANISGQLRS